MLNLSQPVNSATAMGTSGNLGLGNTGNVGLGSSGNMGLGNSGTSGLGSSAGRVTFEKTTSFNCHCVTTHQQASSKHHCPERAA